MSAASKSQAAAVAEAARAELRKRNLLDFCAGVNRNFTAPRHLRYIADKLEAIERGDITRLAISVHPGSGKSTLLQHFCAWYLGRNPQRRIIATSAGAELAERNSRATRALFSEDAWPFPNVRLSAETLAQHRWETNASGGLVAVGVDAIITGWRGNLIVGDDLQNSAGTENERARLWQWFAEILYPRLEPGGAIVIIQTRWGEDDLIGRIQESEDAGDWVIVNIPAIAGEDDVLGRVPGEALWPERFDLAELDKRRVAMGSRAFESQFLGRPVPLDGNVFHAAWLQRYTVAPVRAQLERSIVSLDAAAKTGIANDDSAIAVLGMTQRLIPILEIRKDKVEFGGLRRMLLDVCEYHKPNAVLVEDTTSGIPLIQELQRDTRLPIIPVKPQGSKIARAEAVTGMFESGRVVLPADAPWLLDFERQLLGFPNVKHDDMVDAVVQGLTYVAGCEQYANRPASIIVDHYSRR